jgi:hypothetical protein
VFPSALAWLTRPRRTAFDTAAPAEDALMVAVAVLRHIGARITRYDADAGSLEARLPRWWRDGLVRVSAAGEAPTRITVESEMLGARALERVLRAELTKTGQGR